MEMSLKPHSLISPIEGSAEDRGVMIQTRVSPCPFYASKIVVVRIEFAQRLHVVIPT